MQLSSITKEAIGNGGGNIPLLELVQRSNSGRNLFLNIGKPGKVRGTDVRNLLGLPATTSNGELKENYYFQHQRVRPRGGYVPVRCRWNG